MTITLTLDATTNMVAEMLHISPETVEELAGAGLMPGDKLGVGPESFWCFDSQAVARMFGIA